MSSLANNNIEINPAVKVSLVVFVCFWHKLGKDKSTKKVTQNKVCALEGTEFVITLSLQATGCKTSKKSSQFLTSVISNLKQWMHLWLMCRSWSLIKLQGCFLPCSFGLITVNSNVLSGCFLFYFLSPKDPELKSSWYWL